MPVVCGGCLLNRAQLPVLFSQDIAISPLMEGNFHQLTLVWTAHRSSESMDARAFTGTDRGLLRLVLGPWSPVPKCEAPGAPISVEEHTSMVPRPRRQSQNPPLQKSSAIPA